MKEGVTFQLVSLISGGRPHHLIQVLLHRVATILSVIKLI